MSFEPDKLRPPRRQRRRRLEASIEGACRAYALDRGWVSRKMNGLGFRSWPDRLFLPPKRSTPRKDVYGSGQARGERFFVEFKRGTEEPTPAQASVHRDLRARGETVYICHTTEEFRAALARQTKSRATSAAEL